MEGRGKNYGTENKRLLQANSPHQSGDGADAGAGAGAGADAEGGGDDGGGGGRMLGCCFNAALANRCAEMGAVRNMNNVTNNSCIFGLFFENVKYAMEASNTQPTPSVEILVGPCKRFKKLSSLASP